MSTAKTFEELEIWQLSRKLVSETYSVTKKGPFSKDFSMKDQIRRSALSVMNNISEGFESRTVNMFIEYLGRSKASCGETRSICYAALDQNYINQREFRSLVDLCQTIASKTYHMMKYLERYNSNDRVKEIEIKYKP